MDDATVARRGTDFLLAGTAHEAKAGVRTPLAGACGWRALDWAGPGTGEATPAHAPARPLWS
jgi:hypothetical protein